MGVRSFSSLFIVMNWLRRAVYHARSRRPRSCHQTTNARLDNMPHLACHNDRKLPLLVLFVLFEDFCLEWTKVCIRTALNPTYKSWTTRFSCKKSLYQTNLRLRGDSPYLAKIALQKHFYHIFHGGNDVRSISNLKFCRNFGGIRHIISVAYV